MKVPQARVRQNEQVRATKGVTRAKQEVEIGAMGRQGVEPVKARG